ncbi:MAG: hypothetical protein J2P19_22190, partial [Pseudonocardia sp.]|nr:hypothetical protein [Pseudonocardia sp.]
TAPALLLSLSALGVLLIGGDQSAPVEEDGANTLQASEPESPQPSDGCEAELPPENCPPDPGSGASGR